MKTGKLAVKGEESQNENATPTIPVTVLAHETLREQALTLTLKSGHPPVFYELVPVKYHDVLNLPAFLLFTGKVLGQVIT